MRKHQHILNVGRCLKAQSGLSTDFWIYFIGHAMHLINRTLTPLLNNNCPYKRLFKRPVDYSSLRSFSYLDFVSTLERNMTKFDSRSEKEIFLGYKAGIKGFRIYSLKSNMIVLSKNVKFHETVFPYKQSLDDTLDKYDHIYTDELKKSSLKGWDINTNDKHRKSKRIHN